MSWIAPEVTRTEEPFVADERTMLEGWLDWHRATLLRKCAGLTGEQLARRPVPPSSLSLLGHVRHMEEVGRSWFRRRFAGEPLASLAFLYCSDESPEADFDGAAAAGAAADFAALGSEVELARAATAGHLLDEVFCHSHRKVNMNLRWVCIHLIGEYARHNGHADLSANASTAPPATRSLSRPAGRGDWLFRLSRRTGVRSASGPGYPGRDG